MGMILDVPNSNRIRQARLINLQQLQGSRSALGTAPRYTSGMSFNKPMIARLDGSARCGGCGK